MNMTRRTIFRESVAFLWQLKENEMQRFETEITERVRFGIKKNILTLFYVENIGQLNKPARFNIRCVQILAIFNGKKILFFCAYSKRKQNKTK